MKVTIKKKQEAKILEVWVQMDRDQKSREVPSKRAVRNQVERRASHRLQSPRMRAVIKQTRNPVRAMYQSAETAARSWQGVAAGDESIMTRNVGPSDLDQNYQHGKATGYRSA